MASDVKILCSHYSYVAPLVSITGVKPITVCELLAHRMDYNGRDIALIGRADDSGFDGAWLTQENCATRVVTDGHTWPSAVADYGGSSGPVPPSGILILDEKTLKEKLADLRRTTRLEMYEAPFFRKDGGRGTRLVKQRWAVVYGRIETRQDLHWPRTSATGRRDWRDWWNGFGQMRQSPAAISYVPENRFEIEDTNTRIDPRCTGEFERPDLVPLKRVAVAVGRRFSAVRVRVACP